jgi:hypothetical protein
MSEPHSTPATPRSKPAKPPPISHSLRALRVCGPSNANSFLPAKQAVEDTGEGARLTWGDHRLARDEIVATFGRRRPS